MGLLKVSIQGRKREGFLCKMLNNIWKANKIKSVVRSIHKLAKI